MRIKLTRDTALTSDLFQPVIPRDFLDFHARQLDRIMERGNILYTSEREIEAIIDT